MTPTIDLLDNPLADDDWIRLSEGEGSSRLFSSPPWLRAVAQTYDFQPEAVIVRSIEGHYRAGLPFCRVTDGLGDRVRAFPFSDYTDPVGAVDGPTLAAICEALAALEAPCRVRFLDAPSADLVDSGFDRAEVAWHEADLTDDPETAWMRIHSGARRNIRRARDAGVTIREGTELADIETFYALHRALRRSKYRLLAQPWAFFENLYEQFRGRDAIRVLLAEHDGEVVAGLLLIDWQNTLYYKFNASVDGATRPNDLLIWEALSRGHQAGLQTLDFGVSDLDQPGLIRFKGKFATRESRVTQLDFGPPSVGDAGLRAALPQLTALLTDPRVPDDLTQQGGDLLYRYFT